jgi:integrase
MAIERVKFPNLQYRKRKEGWAVYWVAPPKSSHVPRTINLTAYLPFPDVLLDMAKMYNDDLTNSKPKIAIDQERGTIKELIRRYELDEESPYHELSKGTLEVYSHYLVRLFKQIGYVRITSVTGKELVQWFNGWSENKTKVATAQTRLAVLKALVKYGISCRVHGCVELMEVIRATSTRLPKPKKRTQYVSADQVAALRKAAHEAGYPSFALAYALVFETLVRLFDVTQQLDWSMIDDDLVLKFVPTKTAKRSGVAVTYPLTAAPMVMAELEPFLKDGKPRSGPVVAHPKTGKRYTDQQFQWHFRKHADAVGLPKDVWARDLRSSGVTEARLYGADISDLAKVAGHTSSGTTSTVYDRAVLAAAERVAARRSENRKAADANSSLADWLK